MTIFSDRSCPTCNGTSFSKPNLVDKKVFSHNISEYKNYWYGLTKEKLFLPYSRCQSCGQLYAQIYFNNNVLTELYSEMPPNMESVDKSLINTTQLGYFQSVKDLDFPNGDYLELGPDVGYFVNACIDLDKFNKFILVEPNIAVHSELTKVCEGVDFSIHSEFDSYANIPDNSLSFVVLIHVLDHLVDPGEFVSTISKKMVNNGVLMTVTHDESSFLSKILKDKWPAVCIQHPQLYNKSTLEKLLVNFGFSEISINKTYNCFSLGFLFEQFLWLFKIKTPSAFKNINIPVRLKLGNIISVSRKITNEY